MADEFQLRSGNWWDSSSSRLESNTSPSSSSLSGLSFIHNHPIDSHHVSVPGPSNLVPDPSLQNIGLGLSSQPMSNWNQTLLRSGKPESNYQQETGMGSSTQGHWTQKLYSGSSEDSSINDYKQINPGLSLDQAQFSPQINANNFQMDPNNVYGGGSSATFQGLLGIENQQQGSSNNYGFPQSYGETLGSWSKFPQFLGNSPPKQATSSPLQFSNNTPFWNPNMGPMNDVRPSYYPSSQSQFSSPNFEEKPKSQFSSPNFKEKPKNISDIKDFSTTAKKNSCEPSSKRTRNEAPSPLPAFKVRKEKMGDRITALQQLVSPFGKTDTASVLSEAIEYIKFLHEQVGVLSNPYLKSGASIHHHQNIIDKSKDSEGPKQDLRSRGLCLVPVSSTFPVTHETTVDFWTPTFGGTFR